MSIIAPSLRDRPQNPPKASIGGRFESFGPALLKCAAGCTFPIPFGKETRIPVKGILDQIFSVEQGPLGDAGLFRDFFGGRPLDAFVTKQLQRNVEDALFGFFLVLLAFAGGAPSGWTFLLRSLGGLWCHINMSMLIFSNKSDALSI